MKRVENVLIDLKSNNYRELILKQMDSTQLIFSITENGKPLFLENVNANLIFTKPNGRVVIQDSEISIIENRIKIDLIPDCVRDYGKGIIEVELKENNEVVSTFQLICKIEKTGKDFTPSSNNDNYYEKVEKILEELQQKLENGEFNGLTAYQVAVNLGFTGTEDEWINSLKAKSPVKGKDYFTNEDILAIINELKESEEFNEILNKYETRTIMLESEVFAKEKIKSESNTLTLEDTEEGLNIDVNEIESNKMEQEILEGYNKFKNYSYNNDSVTDAVTDAGITVTLQENGKVLVNGTSTQDVWFEIMYALQSRNFYAI